MDWKKGRGKLGVLSPLLGEWRAESDSPMGRVQCTRCFETVLSSSYVQLSARWRFDKGVYEERALYGLNANRQLTFWSFTSDGKHSEGQIADASDIHPKAIGFEAQMPAGLARMIYWPNEEGGLSWAVESKSKKGWRRFTEHHYVRVS